MMRQTIRGRRVHDPILEQGRLLHSVVSGHVRSHGVPIDRLPLHLFRFQVG